MNALVSEGRDDLLHLTITDERIAAHKRDMQRLQFVDQFEDARDQLVTAGIRERSQCDAVAAEVRVVIGVTAGAAQGALASDLDRERGFAAGKNARPRMQHFSGLHKCLSRWVVGNSRFR
jgi:hypothetical protein